MNTVRGAWDSLKESLEKKAISKKVQWYSKQLSAKLGSDAILDEHVSKWRAVSGHVKALGDPVKESLIVLCSKVRDRVISECSQRKELVAEKRKSEAEAKNDGNTQGVFDKDACSGNGDDTDTLTILRTGTDNSRQQGKKKKKKRKKKKKKERDEINHGGEIDDGTALVRVNDGIECTNSGGVSSGTLCTSLPEDSKECSPENPRYDHVEESHFSPVGDLQKYSAVKVEQHSVGENLESDSIDLMTFSSPKISESIVPTFSPEFALKVGSRSRSSWWVDSGASQHFSWDKDDFVSYTPFGDPVKVNLADNTHVLAHGWGQVKLMLYDVNRPVGVILNNALYVPRIQNKLFSVSSACEEGGKLVFDKDGVTLTKNGKSRKIALKRNNVEK